MNRLAGSNPAPSATCYPALAASRPENGDVIPLAFRLARRLPPAAIVRLTVLALGGMLAGCHGSTLDSIYPGSVGHTPPPAANLPPQDCAAPPPGAWPSCVPAPRPS
jgi:hypothetical protein